MTTIAAARPPPSPAESLTIQPPAPEWRALLRTHPIGDQARRFRSELGLPTDRPVVMTGHQAEWWHPGIVAKFFAADSAARAFGAAAAWVIVDQDDPPADATIRWPQRDADGRLVVRTMDLLGRSGEAASDPGSPRPGGFPFVEEGLRRIQSAWQALASEPSAPRRLTGALGQLLAPYLSPPAVVFGSTLSRTDLFRQLVAAMAADPAACCEAYNAAARAHPTAGIRPLVVDEVQDRYELPLWRLAPGGPRRRVYAESLAEIPTDELAPRALLLTGFLRLGACDLFIHGTGGGGTSEDGGHEGYDRVTDDWLAAWGRAHTTAAGLLGAPLAPVTVVTSTRRLPLLEGDPPGLDDVARAYWTAHHARHDPAMVGEPGAAIEKRGLVAAIAAAPRHSRVRRDRFSDLHVLLDRVDRAHAEELAAFAERARDVERRRADWAIAAERTWPFPLYPGEVIRDLRERIEAAFGG